MSPPRPPAAALVAADAAGIARAAGLIRQGALVAFPTETVYGLGADATDGRAVAAIYEAKGRPRFNPLIAHVDTLARALKLVDFDPLSLRLAQRFWPGPLTLVLPLRPDAGISSLATAGLDTLAVRLPDHPVARALVAAADRPVVAPSANLSGHVSPSTARHVAEDLGDRLPLILDGGPTGVGVESTILQVRDDGVHLLRPGGLASEEIEAETGAPLIRHAADPVEAPLAPGMLTSHYAPQARVRLEATEVAPDEVLIAFGPVPVRGADAARAVHNLSPSGDLREAAARLFSLLRAADLPDAAGIAVAPLPATGLGEAILDRLTRAAAPRDSRA